MLIQYIYCMDLTEEELPSQVEAVNLSQIGLVKYPKLPCKPLLVKVRLFLYQNMERHLVLVLKVLLYCIT